MKTNKNRWKSKTVWAGVVAGLVSIMGFVATVTGNPDLSISAEFQAQIMQAIMSMVTTASAIIVIIGRFKASHKIK